MQKEDWLAAIDKLKQVNAIFPNYEDTGNRLRRSLSEGTRAMYQQGTKLAKQEDWKGAAESFKAVMDVNPKFLDAAQQYANAVKMTIPLTSRRKRPKPRAPESWTGPLPCTRKPWSIRRPIPN